MVTLNTLRLVLRSTDETDAEFIARLESRAEVGEYIGGLSARKLDSHYFTVLFGGTRVGQVALVSELPPSEDYAIVCALLSEAEGCGLATEACDRVFQWAFEDLSLSRVLAHVDDSNTQSEKLIRRLQMEEFELPSGGRCFARFPATAT